MRFIDQKTPQSTITFEGLKSLENEYFQMRIQALNSDAGVVCQKKSVVTPNNSDSLYRWWANASEQERNDRYNLLRSAIAIRSSRE